MTVVTPICNQIANSPILYPILGSIRKVCKAVICPPSYRIPGRSARADIESLTRCGEYLGMFFKRVISFITPLQGNTIFWKITYKLRMSYDHIPPKLQTEP